MNVSKFYEVDDNDLPEGPKLEIYKETFGGLENITKEWYKNSKE